MMHPIIAITERMIPPGSFFQKSTSNLFFMDSRLLAKDLEFPSFYRFLKVLDFVFRKVVSDRFLYCQGRRHSSDPMGRGPLVLSLDPSRRLFVFQSWNPPLIALPVLTSGLALRSVRSPPFLNDPARF